METSLPITVAPSAHALSLAGVDLLEAAPPVVRVESAREVCVVLSRSRAPRREVHLDRCLRDGVPVVVRPSGGGAVVLAPGVVAASVLVDARGGPTLPDPWFRSMCGHVARALETCGVCGVALRGVSDLCVGERKVAGSALRLFRARALFQVSVLVDVDVALLERYLRTPSRAPAYRRGRGHRDFVTTLAEAGSRAGVELVRAALESTLGGVLDRLHRAGADV